MKFYNLLTFGHLRFCLASASLQSRYCQAHERLCKHSEGWVKAE